VKAAIIWISALILMVCAAGGNAQSIDVKLQDQMVTLERDVVRIYNELQKYLLQDFQQDDELLAFETLMTVYVDEILDLFDTYYRINETTLESHQKIAARCLLFRSLTFMERAETSVRNYERACRDYRRALLLVKDHSYEPLLNSTLPYEVWIGDKLYTRIVDLIDNRNKNFQMVNCLKISSGTGKQ
jgi:hypothetical protein